MFRNVNKEMIFFSCLSSYKKLAIIKKNNVQYTSHNDYYVMIKLSESEFKINKNPIIKFRKATYIKDLSILSKTLFLSLLITLIPL